MSFVSGCCCNRWDTSQMFPESRGFPLGSTRSGCKMDHWAPGTPPSSHPWSGELRFRTLVYEMGLGMPPAQSCEAHGVGGARPPRVPEVLNCRFLLPEAFCMAANWPWTFHLDLVITLPPGVAKSKHHFPTFPMQKQRPRG